MNKVTLEEYKQELEEQLLTASTVQQDSSGTDWQYEMSEAEEIKEILFDLENTENQEAILACRNCNLDGEWEMLPCPFCSFGENLPPN